MTGASDMSALRLPPVMDLVAAPDLRTQLIEKLAVGEGTVLLDASEVERVTTPCVQVLLSAALSLAQTDAELKIENASAAFADAMRTLGLDDQLKQWCK